MSLQDVTEPKKKALSDGAEVSRLDGSRVTKFAPEQHVT